MNKKYTLITGASSGIGLELAKIAASENRNLILVARHKKALEDLKDELASESFDVKILALDLTKPNSATQLYDFSTSDHKLVNVLINNAGFGDMSDFIVGDIKKQLAIIDLNVRSLTEISRLFLPQIVQHDDGKVMNVASTAAFTPGPGMNVYYATKHYVLAFSEALSEELSSTSTTITALCPGPTKTGFAKEAHAQSSKLFRGNIPTAKEVAEFGWKAMQSGKRVAIHGKRNKFMTQIVKVFPRRFITRTVRRVQP